MGDRHLVLPAMNLSTLDYGILINGATGKIFFYDVFIEHGGLLHVLPLAGGPHDFIVSPIPLVTNLGLKPGWGWALSC